MKKIKVLVMAVAIAIYSTTGAFAAGNNVLDIDAAIKYALKNSPDVQTQLNQIEIDKNNYNKALQDADKAAGKLADDELARTNLAGLDPSSGSYQDDLKKYSAMRLNGEQRFNCVIQRDLGPLEAQQTVTTDTNQEEVTENTVKYSVYSQYILLLNAQDALKLSQDNAKLSKDTYNKAQLQLQLGLITQKDMLKSGQVPYLSSNASLSKQQRAITVNQMQFNLSIGEDISKKYDQYSQDFTDIDELQSLDYYVNKALQNRSDILADQQSLDLAKKEYDVLSNEDTVLATHRKLVNYKVKIDTDQQTLDLAKLQIQSDVTNAYTALKTKMLKLDGDKKSLEKPEHDYNVAKQKCELGLISNIDLETAEVNYNKEKNNIKLEQRDVWVAQKNLEFICNKGIKASATTGTN
jgi:outer membrane protein TolC